MKKTILMITTIILLGSNLTFAGNRRDGGFACDSKNGIVKHNYEKFKNSSNLGSVIDDFRLQMSIIKQKYTYNSKTMTKADFIKIYINGDKDFCLYSIYYRLVRLLNTQPNQD